MCHYICQFDTLIFLLILLIINYFKNNLALYSEWHIN